ncbi:hypothetical protein GMORB2_5242 [Geosmithia morbida]|uniref:Uncharacterized protein n=1 Tax=Geosmithia morbida TaxID=1094350 RepID=A0A9P5D5I3_9HYPO|nr:uncharacterized protein GMORB2_5242 [Geosmithia morbida]KAF4124576.1 hypothetical protein GMORB2_5242 [Geosmithia morbida]
MLAAPARVSHPSKPSLPPLPAAGAPGSWPGFRRERT